MLIASIVKTPIKRRTKASLLVLPCSGVRIKSKIKSAKVRLFYDLSVMKKNKSTFLG